MDDDSGPGVDSLISDPLVTGTYTLVLTVFNVFGPPNLSDPFPVNANKDFGGFTNAWAVDLLGVQNAALIGSTANVTEAGSAFGLFAAAATALALLRRKLSGRN